MTTKMSVKSNTLSLKIKKSVSIQLSTILNERIRKSSGANLSINPSIIDVDSKKSEFSSCNVTVDCRGRSSRIIQTQNAIKVCIHTIV